MSLPPYPSLPARRLLRLDLADEDATRDLATRLAVALAPGMVVTLSGGLGAGKTTLVRHLLRALGHPGRVRSPTFTLLEPYELEAFPVHHFDFYRFSNPDEWRDAGFQDYFGGAGVCLVEWPELAGPELPPPDLHLHLAFGGERRGEDEGEGESEGGTARQIVLSAFSDAGERCLNAAAAAC
jgi:tRNA threonylcarbamoyladenosine biosynthesis protein TsaE